MTKTKTQAKDPPGAKGRHDMRTGPRLPGDGYAAHQGRARAWCYVCSQPHAYAEGCR